MDNPTLEATANNHRPPCLEEVMEENAVLRNWVEMVVRWGHELNEGFIHVSISYFDALARVEKLEKENEFLKTECGRLACLVSIRFPDQTMPDLGTPLHGI